MEIWITATLLAFLVKGLCGFANTLVFTSILSFGANHVLISPVELLLGYPTNLILAWKNRNRLKRSVWLPLAALVLAGSIPGALLLKNMNAQLIKIIFGFAVIMIGTEMLFRKPGSRPGGKGSGILLGGIGLCSGLLCGLFGVGALLAAYVGRVTDTPDEFKANISAVFIVENTFRILLYTGLGVITSEVIRQAVFLMPFMLIGLFAGMACSRILNESIVQKLVIILLILSGVVLIIGNL